MKTIDADLFLRMLENGANNLSNNHQLINALNVFPVPDGDTGTNMNLTFTNGLNAAKKSMSSHLGEMTKVLSRGLLMGARGNSGVILSQIFRGFAQGLEDKQSANVMDVAKAFQSGKEAAYKAVMRPVEGTILTVLRESAEEAFQYASKNPEIDMTEYFEFLVNSAQKSLDNTPNLLPVLKEVGVVDSGGKGYVTVLEGFLATLKGEVIEAQEAQEQDSQVADFIEHDEFGYCTEFIIRLDDAPIKSYSEAGFRAELEAIGNSLVVVTDEDLVKVHVHTLKPGNALNLGQQYGEFVKLKIENMTEQHDALTDHHVLVEQEMQAEEESEFAIVSVAAGEGIVSLFKELRAEHIISGGQTMNPSTEDFVAKIEKINAKNIFVLPNNSNILLAAKQAQDIIEDKNIVVLESKTIPQGLSACLMFNPEADLESNIQEMTEAIAHTKTGQVTYAIKDTMFESMEIKKDHFMGIKEKDIIVTNPDKIEATRALCAALIDEDSEIVTLIAGEDVDEETLNALAEELEEKYDVEVDPVMGQQPVYSFIIGVE
ncbi:MAG TPA: DAK2 domain-containing protein [Erysipelothrix sp.]